MPPAARSAHSTAGVQEAAQKAKHSLVLRIDRSFIHRQYGNPSHSLGLDTSPGPSLQRVPAHSAPAHLICALQRCKHFKRNMLDRGCRPWTSRPADGKCIS